MVNSLAEHEEQLHAQPVTPYEHSQQIGRMLNSTIADHLPVCKPNFDTGYIWKFSLALACLRNMHLCLVATADSDMDAIKRAHVVLTRFFYESFLEMKDYQEDPEEGIEILEDIEKTVSVEARGNDQIPFELNKKKKLLLPNKLYENVSMALSNVSGELMDIAATISCSSPEVPTVEIPKLAYPSSHAVLHYLRNTDRFLKVSEMADDDDLTVSAEGTIRKVLKEMSDEGMVDYDNHHYRLKDEFRSR